MLTSQQRASRINTCAPTRLLTGALLAVLLLAFALRTIALQVPEPTGDEGFSYVFTKFSVSEMMTKTIEMIEPHPIGYYIIEKAWMALAGMSEFAIRFPSVLAGVALIALVYRFTRQIGLERINKAIPLIAAGLMTVNAFAVHYGREMRMYAIHQALTLTSTLLVVALMQRPRWRTVLAYVVVSWIALNVHYYAGFVFVAQNLFVFSLLIARGLRNYGAHLGHWVIAQVALAAAGLPWVWYARTVLFSYHGNDVRGATLPDIVIDLLGNYVIGHGFPDLYILAACTGSALFLLGLWRIWSAGRQTRQSAWLLLLYFGVPILAGWLAAQNRPIYTARYFIATLTPFLVPIAASLAMLGPILRTLAGRLGPGSRRGPLSMGSGPAITRQAVLGALAAALGVMFAVGFRYDFAVTVIEKKPVWHDYLRVFDRFTSDLPATQTRPVLNYPNPVFTYYYDPRGEYVTLPFQPDDLEGAKKAVQVMKDAGVRRIVFQVFPSWWDNKHVAETAITTEYTKIDEAWTGTWLAKIYSRVEPSELKPVDTTYSDGVTLGAALVRPDLRAHLVEVNLQWHGVPERLKGTEKLFIHISPAANPFALPAQLDLPLTTSDCAHPVCTFGIRLPDGLPSGPYVVRVGLYDPGLPNAPRLTTNAGKDSVDIATFNVP